MKQSETQSPIVFLSFPLFPKRNNKFQTSKINNNINLSGSNKTFWFVNKQGSFSWICLFSILFFTLPNRPSPAKTYLKYFFKICLRYLNVNKGKDGETEERSPSPTEYKWFYTRQCSMKPTLSSHTANLDNLNIHFKSCQQSAILTSRPYKTIFPGIHLPTCHLKDIF